MFKKKFFLLLVLFNLNLLSIDIYEKIPVIETKNLILRPLMTSDANDLFEFTSDPEVVKLTGMFKLQYNLQETVNYIEKVSENYKKKLSVVWAVLHKPTKKVIGIFSIFSYIPPHSKAEIGGAGSRIFWNQGLGTEAAQAMISFGFEQMKLNRIQATCDPRNIVSKRLIEKVGMKYEGCLRQYYYLQNTFCDRYIYSIIKDDIKNK